MAPIRDLPGRPSKPSTSRLKSEHRRSETAFATNKKDKQRIKHSQFVSKIVKSSATSKKPRSRRASKKLVTGLDELVHALPNDGDQRPLASGLSNSNLQNQVQIIKQKSLKSRPGALKRKDNLEKRERERFVKNMAQMAAAPSQIQQEDGQMMKTNLEVQTPAQHLLHPVSTGEKFAALRAFISQTMEHRPGSERAKS